MRRGSGRNAVASEPMASAKRSISFDPKLLAAAENLARAEYDGNLSALVNSAVRESIGRNERLRKLREFLDQMDREFGPVPEAIKAEIDEEIEEWESRSIAER